MDKMPMTDLGEYSDFTRARKADRRTFEQGVINPIATNGSRRRGIPRRSIKIGLRVECAPVARRERSSILTSYGQEGAARVTPVGCRLTVPSDSLATFRRKGSTPPRRAFSALRVGLQMSAARSLIPELEDIVQHGSPRRRAQALRRITTLFLDGASLFNDDHVRLFGDVFNRLIDEIETKARAELSRHLAPVGNAPGDVICRLAHDDDIRVAGPVLRQSRRLAETDLVEIAETKSQAHLLAISGRPGIAAPVTNVLVRRGDREVACSVVENRGAALSDHSFTVLVAKSEGDDALGEKVGQRPDIPPPLFRALLLKATAVVQQRLFASATPEVQAEIRSVLARVSKEVGTKAAPRDYREAQRTIAALRLRGQLNEGQILNFAKANQYEEMIAGLADLCAVPIDVVDRLMDGERPDPILILCKSAGWGWPTARAIMGARLGRKANSSQGLDAAYSNFERLTPATAARVIRFWQMGPLGSRRAEDAPPMTQADG
jgi:uncharacterized protein (DUF2336 family)